MRHQLFACCLLLAPVIAVAAVGQDAGAQQDPTSSPEPAVQAGLSLRNANYEIDAQLDTATKIVAGSETLTWTNVTEHPAPDLRFHLYYNAWRNSESSFLSSLRYRSMDLSERRDDEWAYSDVKSVEILPGPDEVGGPVAVPIEFIQPDDGNESDRTVMRIALPRPVEPGETIRVRIEWDAKVPRTFARTGTIGDYFFLAQWFPKIGVFEADGTWNCHQFIQTEFYADFGVYDVRMTVPTGWILGATGREQSVTDNGDGTSTHHYFQEDVHDFTWVTTPHFLVHEQRFEEPDLPTVDMRLLLMPDHADRAERYFAATSAALKYYGTWWGAYPYDHITVVDPAYQSGTGGMEYPTFFTGGTRWLSPPWTGSPEGVTIHEAGHQFWYGIVANNEFENAWMDEGFNTYSTTRTSEAAYPPGILTRRYFNGFFPVAFPSVPSASRTAGADAYAGFQSDLKRDPMALGSWEHGPGSYGLNSYGKPGMMLRTLENYLGWETFQEVMSTYFERYKFRHPRPEDFFAVVHEVSGEDMSWFFEQIYGGSNVFDYAVESVNSWPVSSPIGYAETTGGLVFDAGDQEGDAEMYRSTVIVRRWGESVFPVSVEVTFDDGQTIGEEWNGEARWARFDYTRPARVATVAVDPERVLTLDIDSTNNTWTSEPAARPAARKWAAKWMIWVQSLLEFFAFFS